MIEERQKSLQAVGIDDIFGSGMRPQQMLHMAEMEAAAEDTLLVILSDLQLDKPLVSYAEALHLLLMLPVVHVISSHSSLSSSCRYWRSSATSWPDSKPTESTRCTC
jgi:hypothetical protein